MSTENTILSGVHQAIGNTPMESTTTWLFYIVT